MNKKILEMLNEPKSIDEILSLLKVYNIDTTKLENKLRILELSGIIYYDANTHKYELFPDNFFVVKIVENPKDHYYFYLNNKKYFMPIYKLNYALNGDTVIIEEKNDFFHINKILDRGNVDLLGNVKYKNGKKYILPFSFPTDYPVLIKNDDNIILNDGDIVTVNLSTEMINECYIANVVEVNGHMYDLNDIQKRVIKEFGFRTSFSEESLKEAAEINEIIKDEDLIGRKDLRDEVTITIDCDTCKDMDDAISITKTENSYILKVHIAHVSHYVKFNSALFKEAAKNGASIYLGGNVLPMLVHTLSSNVCSLHENSDRLTITTEMHFDFKGNKIYEDVYRSIIHSNKKTTYTNVTKYLEEKEVTPDYIEILPLLDTAKELFYLLEEKSKQRGTLVFESGEVSFINNKNEVYDNENVNNLITSREESISDRLIAHFMIESNISVANILKEYLNPYRVHRTPNIRFMYEAINKLKDAEFDFTYNNKFSDPSSVKNILDQLKNHENFIVASLTLLMSQARAEYSVENSGHYGLSLESYTHSTSPIRRLIDLINQYLIDYKQGFFKEEDYNDLIAILPELCLDLSEKEKQISKIEDRILAIEMLEFAQKNIGKEYEAYILDIDEDYIYVKSSHTITGIVEIHNFNLEPVRFNPQNKSLVALNSNNKYFIGDKLIISIKDTNKDYVIYDAIGWETHRMKKTNIYNESSKKRNVREYREFMDSQKEKGHVRKKK